MDGGNGRKGIERLTAKEVAAWIKLPAKDEAKKKLADGGGLYLVRLPTGNASWQVRYRFDGADRTYSVGPSTSTTLADARAARRLVKDQIKAGIDPAKFRQVSRATAIASSGDLFRDAAEIWLKKRKSRWSDIHYKKARQAIERDVMEYLGPLPLREITPAMISQVVERIQKRGARETASKVLQHVRLIFRLAIANGKIDANPAEHASEILNERNQVKHRPALLSFPELGDVLRRADVAPTSPTVRLAHRLIAFTAVRIGNAVAARWADFDLDATPASWVIPRDEMKVKKRDHDHKVVLCDAIANELRTWRLAQTEPGEYVFPGNRGREYVTPDAVEKMLRETLALSDKHCPHGWRASFSTLSKENGFAKEAVDLTLDHIHDSSTARAYDRGERLAKRIELMAWWGSELMKAQHHTTKVVPPQRAVAPTRQKSIVVPFANE